MIEIFEGSIGGGKTYHALLRMIEHWLHGGLVCSNIVLNLDAVKAYMLRRHGWNFQKEQFLFLDNTACVGFHKFTPRGGPGHPVLVVLDEAHVYLNGRDFGTGWGEWKKEFFTWLTQSRHDCTDCIFITQHPKNMDSQIRRLAVFTWRFEDWNLRPLPKIRIPWPFNQFKSSQFNGTGEEGDSCAWFLRWKDTGVYALYDTYQEVSAWKRAEGVQTVFQNIGGDDDMKRTWKLALFVTWAAMLGCLYFQYKRKPPVLPVPVPVDTRAIYQAISNAVLTVQAAVRASVEASGVVAGAPAPVKPLFEEETVQFLGVVERGGEIWVATHAGEVVKGGMYCGERVVSVTGERFVTGRPGAGHIYTAGPRSMGGSASVAMGGKR